MAVRKQSVSFTESAFAFARQLVEEGEYANVSAAVSGELVRAKAIRDRERLLLGAEVERRLRLPLDQWLPVGALDDVTRSARVHLQKLSEPKDKALPE
ncbi:MAG: hypothetical protein OXQ89_04495 [Rhodospirillaceae bacterium]|nr:hypothetical protein [Rhodospirillaceae bacterium]MDD9996986.1 hypothetical protein [Rhodospirillaceae bacterium]